MLKEKILVVDDEKSMREFLEIMLRKEDYKVSLAPNGEEVLRLIERDIFDLVLLDIRMPKMDGIGVLKKIKALSPETVVIMITAYASADTAIKAMKEGAYDYITKPFKVEEIKLIIKNALEKRNLQKENTLLKQVIRDRYHFDNIIGQSSKMLALYDLLDKVGPTKTNILITGESGTGKELVAKAVHYSSPRKDRPFVTLNCGAIPEPLIESELFGHMKGAFTDAIATKKGLFEVADEGTLFLDEISELPLLMQVKLLRVLQDREFKRVGGTEDIRVDVRIIAATNKDLEEAVREKRFREDLFYRLNVIQIKLPPLRERREDIPQLVECLLKKYARGMDTRVEKEAMNRLIQRSWRGNVRELENAIARACILCDYAVIKVVHLEDPNEEKESVAALSGDAVGSVKEMEMKLILDALKSMNGNRTRAASVLGITARTLRNKIKEYRELGLAVP